MSVTDAIPYEILEEVQKESYGTLYRVRHRHLHQSEATLHLFEDPNVCQYLKSVGSIDDCAGIEGTLRIRDCHFASQVPYMVTDWVNGQSLRKRLDAEGVPPLNQAMIWMKTLVHRIGIAHQKGLIHQNLHPETIFITESGDILFHGLIVGGSLARAGAKYFPGDRTELDREYLSGMRYKTHRQRKSENVDEREDIFALGLVFFEMLAGRFPRPGELPSQVCKEIDSSFDRVYARCCTELDKRYRNAISLLKDLELLGNSTLESASSLTNSDSDSEETVILHLAELCGSSKLEENSLSVFREEMEALLAGPTLKVCLGLQGIGHVSSSGLSYLVSIGDRLSQKGGSLLLHGMESRIEQIIEMLGLDDVYNMYSTEEDALNSLTQ
ncbi:MAG: STAS domain-containing protein [Planctomycetota bacterium]|nr:STAS domain-containing protein [Planctomycetota bacterium]